MFFFLTTVNYPSTLLPKRKQFLVFWIAFYFLPSFLSSNHNWNFNHLHFITYCYFTATVVRGFIWKVRRYIHACLTWADVRDYFTFANILIVQIFHLGKFCLSNTFFKGSSLGSRLVNFSFIFVSVTITEGTLLFRENFLWSSACPLNGGFTE